MTGYKKHGAQAVWIAGTGTGQPLSGQAQAANSPFLPIGDHLSDATISTATELIPPATANALMIGFEDQAVRLRMDGGEATTSTGFLFAAGDIITIQFPPGTMIFSIIETTTTATIQYQWGLI